MSPLSNDLYRAFSQFGVFFIGEDNRNQRIRSQVFDFCIMTQTFRSGTEQALCDCRLYTPAGTREHFGIYPRNTMDEDYTHQHDFFDLLYVQSGKINVRIENTTHQYQAGDVCLVNRSVQHTELFDTDYRVVFLHLSKQYVQTLLGQIGKEKIDPALLTFFRDNLTQTDSRKDFLDFRCTVPSLSHTASSALIESLIQEMANLRPGYSSIVQGLVVRLLFTLCTPQIYQISTFHLGASPSDQLFEQIKAYIASNNGILVRKELETLLHYHPDHMNRIVKQRTGMTLVQFAQHYRMEEAARLIHDTDLSIETISQRLGFPNKAYFYRLFKRVHQVTPVAYRAQTAITTQLPDPTGKSEQLSPQNPDNS